MASAATCCIAFALGLGTLAVSAGPTSVRAQASEADADGATARDGDRWWMTDQWLVGGDAITRADGWVHVEGAVAIRTAAGATRWRLRADRLALQLAPTSPRTISALHADGEVRLLGPDPIFVAGRRAVSFRPGRSLVIWSPNSSDDGSPDLPDEPRLVGEGWTLVGTRISVDLLDVDVTVDEVRARRGRSRDRGPNFAPHTGS